MTSTEQARIDRLRHDLRSPLTAIRGFAALLERRDDEAFRLDAAARIQQAAAMLEAALTQVLDELEVAVVGRPLPTSSRCVLVVDDDPVVRELLVATLDAEAFEIVLATDVEDALRLLDVEPDVLILDWRIPGGGGHMVLDAAKNRFPDLPVIVLTGDRAEETRTRVDAGGADVFMTKPFSPLELLATVERLADGDEA
jgi:CheY-like chemotaxis protein